MDSTIPVEQRLIKAIRILAPHQQQAVLDFAEFLQDRQSPEKAISSRTELTPFFGAEERTGGDAGGDGAVSLAERGIDVGQAAQLRSQLQTFSEDWERPEMTIYDEL